MSRLVITFGSYDPLHEGHIQMMREAKARGSELRVVVARDEEIRAVKKREPTQEENERLQKVAAVPDVDDAVLGGEYPHNYELLSDLDFDVLVLGYDQSPSDEEVRKLLQDAGKSHVEVIRLSAHKPEEYKSSNFRPD